MPAIKIKSPDATSPTSKRQQSTSTARPKRVRKVERPREALSEPPELRPGLHFDSQLIMRDSVVEMFERARVGDAEELLKESWRSYDGLWYSCDFPTVIGKPCPFAVDCPRVGLVWSVDARVAI